MQMKRFKVVGLCLVAVFAMSAVVASAASAALPEFKGTLPNKFTSTSGAGVLETVNHKKVECTGDTNSGIIKSAKKAEEIVVKFKGCKGLGGGECESTTPAAKEKEEIATNNLVGTLGYIKKETKEVGLALEPEAGKKELITKIVCLVGGIKEPVEVKGSVIGVITPINTLTKNLTLTFEQNEGKQKVQNLEGKTKDTLETSINGGVFEESGEKTTDSLTTELEGKIEA
jgi:hypothetical protein